MILGNTILINNIFNFFLDKLKFCMVDMNSIEKIS